MPSETKPVSDNHNVVSDKSCPEDRISKSTKTVDGHQVVEISTYIPYLLSSVTNAMSRGASQLYLDRFNVGIVEWRVMSMLAIEPKIKAARICEVVHLDKGATSRALAQLNKAGFLDFDVPGADGRKKIWWLNKAGLKMHDDILEVALGREKQLITGVNPEDLEAFLRVMRQMRINVDTMK